MTDSLNTQKTARITGWSLIATIVIGIATAFTINQGIDINMTADIKATAENMLQAESRLRAKAYMALLGLSLQILISLGLFSLVRKTGPILAGWSLLMGLAAAITTLLGAIFAMNAAMITGHAAFNLMSEGGDHRLLLSGLQATADYTSFHLGLVLSSLSNAGFFLLFMKSRNLPWLIAAWGLFASLFVAFAIVSRDFIPAIGSDIITTAFMLSNLIALISTGLYLGIKGVRTAASSPSEPLSPTQ